MATQLINAMTQLWNNAGTTYAAIKMNVTNSASAAASKLLQLQIGGSDKFTVDKNGAVVAASTVSMTSPIVSNAAASRLAFAANGNLFKRTVITASGTHTFDAETKLALVEVQGGGGGGGNCATSSSGASGGSGGGAGGYVSKLFAPVGVGTVTIGAAGAAAGNGGSSIWSDGTNTLTAGGGGTGGTGSSSSAGVFGNGGVGGTATGGDEN